MIDHISIAVRDLEAGGRFYEAVLATLGYSKMIVRRDHHRLRQEYPDFWINLRPNMATPDPDGGVHICLRARDAEAVDAFHAAALKAGGRSDGAPGPRPEYTPGYYAAFVRDPDGNRIEAVTFVDARAHERAVTSARRRRSSFPSRPPASARAAAEQLRQDVLDRVGHQIVDLQGRAG